MIETKTITIQDVDDKFISSLAESFPIVDDNPDWKIEHVKNFISDSHNIMLIGYLDGAMAGFVYGYVLDRLDDKKKFFVYELSTRKDFRRRGVMSAMLDYLLNKLKEENFDSIWIPTEKENLAAVSLYKKMGGIMQEGGVSFEYNLKEGIKDAR